MKTDTYNPFIDDEEEDFTKTTTLEESENEERDVLDDLLEDDDEDTEEAATTPSARPAPRFTKPRIIVPSPSQTVAHPSESLSEGENESAPTSSNETTTVPQDGAIDLLEDLLEDDDEGERKTKRRKMTKEEVVERALRRTPEERREMRRRVREARERGEFLPGHKKTTRKYRRNEITEKDLKLFEFLAKTRYATVEQLSQLLAVKDCSPRLYGLKEFGFHLRSALFFNRSLWMLGKRGRDAIVSDGRVAEDETSLFAPDTINLPQVQHTLAVAQTMLMALDGSLLKDPVGLSYIKSESYLERLRSSVVPGEMKGVALTTEARAEVIKARHRALDGALPWNMLAETCGAVWIPFDSESRKSHRPDFIIDREAFREGEKPVSYAVEAELTVKKDAALDAIMRAYRDDRQYAGVVYAYGAERVKKHVINAARRVGMPAKRLRFVQIHDRDGNPYKPVWR